MMNQGLRQYLVVTGTYWAFTITDGALRMLVVLYFYQLGYSALQIAMLFLLYEFFGVVTNLVGGWLGARLGLNKTMHLGVLIQSIALLMLAVDSSWLSVPYVMAAQALSGIAKDLNKMSAKSSIKILMPGEQQHGKLYKWVALLTGSKNALKGAGFFIGAWLLATIGFQSSLITMSGALAVVFIISVLLLRNDLGKTKYKPRFTEIFSKSHSVNILSAARLFLFGARDVWFVVALPVYFEVALHWSHTQVGIFMALWIIGYGFVQGLAPALTGLNKGKVPDGRSAMAWAVPLSLIPALIAVSLYTESGYSEIVLVGGLLIFGGLFAINSSIHSFLILAYSKQEGVSLDVGFYYMANAMGRLIGTVLSGATYQYAGLEACLIVSSLFLALTIAISTGLPGRRVKKPAHPLEETQP
ncbi:MAG: MFS transporter [Proteobacteria bacterium]|nr:MAG: MFS transporter [Pseudomonadota bacterium]